MQNVDDIKKMTVDVPKKDDIKSFDVDPEGVLPESVRDTVEAKLANLNKNVDDLSEDDKKKFSDEAIKEYFSNLPRKQKFRKGLLAEGYKSGFTKPTLEARKQDRRKKNKQSKISRRTNRK